jgi:hypothetical protein
VETKPPTFSASQPVVPAGAAAAPKGKFTIAFARAAAAATVSSRDWNGEYVELFERSCMSLHEEKQRSEQLKALIDAFIAEATRVARELITEYLLPALSARRRNKPIRTMSVAGGQKVQRNSFARAAAAICLFSPDAVVLCLSFW